jgi:LPS-assembly lipoprotein
MSRLRASLVAAALLALGGCGLQPVYSGGSKGVAATSLRDIAVAPIANRAGYLVTGELHMRMGDPVDAPHYRLEVELDDQILGFGIRGDNSVTRERRTLRVRYKVVAVATGAVVLDATATSDAGVDRVSSDYAVVAAENTALERLATDLADQIVLRLSLLARSGGLPTP